MQRLTLIPVFSYHAAEMFSILADPGLYNFTGGRPPGSVESVQRWFSSLESRQSPDGTERWLTWIVQLRKQGVAIGYVQATVTNLQANIAWLIGTAWQGQGYAQEASGLLKAWLEENQIERVTAHIHPGHIASQKIAARLGLRPTGASHEGEEIWDAQLGTR